MLYYEHLFGVLLLTQDGENRRSIHEVIEYLPTTNCITPTEAARVYASQNIPRESWEEGHTLSHVTSIPQH